MFTPAEVANRFSYACYHADWGLVTWFPEGVFDNEHADQAVEFIALAEKLESRSFNRYIDLSGYSSIQISLDHVVRIARRRQSYQGPPVKSAIFAVPPTSLTVASMYQELMNGSHVEVGVFQDRAIAAEWLGVPTAILQPPNTIQT